MSDEPDDDQDESEAGTEPELASGSDDAASPSAIKEKGRRLSREQREALDFWRGIFSTPIGRREMWKLLTEAHTFEERFACGPNGFPQPEATWFQAGEQALGQRMYRSWARDHRVEVLLMHDENDKSFAETKKATK